MILINKTTLRGVTFLCQSVQRVVDTKVKGTVQPVDGDSMYGAILHFSVQIYFSFLLVCSRNVMWKLPLTTISMRGRR